jgi:hypothetical protein
MRPRLRSSDSFRAVAGDERELILRELQRLEGRLLGRFGTLEEVVQQHAAEIQDLRAAVIESRAEQIETRALRNKVEQLLGQDLAHDARLARIEAQRAGQQAQATAELGAEEAKHSARATSRRWSAVGTAVASIIAAAVAHGAQQCSAPEPPPKPTYQPKP